MKKPGLFQFLCLFVLSLTVGCSTQKNTAINRFYHEINAQYNVYFNAKESVKEGLARIEDQMVEDYTRLLPLFPEASPNASQMVVAQMEYAVQKCLKLIENHSITKSPKRKTNKSEAYVAFAYKSEYNKWIDDAYLLMGQAHYYLRDFHKAQESFNFVLHNFSDQPTRHPAFLWLSRCYLETGEYEKAIQILKLLERDGSLPDQIKKDLAVIKAEYYMKTGEWKEAIFQLNQALKLDLTRKEKGRYNFILAQLYLRQGANELAVEAFNRVVKSKPTSRMAFEAKISLLEFSDMNSEVVMQALSKMIKSANNMRYLDRIYYARGEIELKSGNRLEAIRDFTTSVTHSLDNNNQRALSGLTAARLFYEDGNYRLASCYYDSTLAVIDNNYPGYEEIFAKTNGLSVLVRNLNQIEKEDSLQRVATMPEAERLAYINKFIAKVTEEENQRLKEAQLEQNSANYFRGQQYRPGMGNQANNSLWYFYNPVTAGLGKTEFQQIWGKRKLEDNWRRKNKISLNQMDQEPGDNMSDLQQKDSQQSKASDPKTVDYYLHDLPLTDSLMRASHDRIKSALFASGRIYLNILKNEPLAIMAFDELNKRYPGSIYELPTWIELYKINHETALYKERITGKYPESNYAKFLVNPDFFKELEVRRQLTERKYSEAGTLYQRGDYAGAGRMATEVMSLQPDSLLLPQVKYMELIARGKNSSNEDFAKMLDNYLSDFPNSPAVPTVAKIRELILQNSLAELEKNIARMDSAALRQTKNQPSLQKNDPFGGKYSYDEDLFHYFVISFPGEAKVDVNRLIFDIANFNIDYYTSFDFDIEEVRLNGQTKLVVVRSLPTKEEGLGYFGNILRQKVVFQSLKNVDYHHFIASSPNYRKLIADQDLIEYLNFFVLNYSKNSSPKP